MGGRSAAVQASQELGMKGDSLHMTSSNDLYLVSPIF